MREDIENVQYEKYRIKKDENQVDNSGCYPMCHFKKPEKLFESSRWEALCPLYTVRESM
jgi:hypothetical protein